MPEFAWQFLRRAGQVDVRRRVDLTVEGLENLPASGPVLMAARHYHHLHDGAALIATIPRPTRILVGLDWIESTAAKSVLDRACQAAGWPVVLRQRPGVPVSREALSTLFKALDESVAILKRGEVLIVFPEGYPTVDPTWTPKTRDDEVLPFQPGLVRIARRAAQQGIDVPIVPVGLEYQAGDRWRLALRIGPALFVPDQPHESRWLEKLRCDVCQLSGLD